MRPFVGHDAFRGVRGILQRVVFFVETPLFHSDQFSMDGDQRIAVSIKFLQRFAFGWFDHQGAGNRPTHGGRVKSVIHEALGHILDFDAGALLPLAEVEDAFVGHSSAFALVEDGEMRIEALCHVVGVEDGDLGRVLESGGAHHADIHP